MKRRSSVLDMVVLNVEGNPWTVRDACTGCMVFGQTGSGKTSGPLNTIRDTYLSLGFGGIVFCAKPDEAGEWEKACARQHREKDFLRLSQLTFNFLDHEARRCGCNIGNVENIVLLYLEVVNIGRNKGKSNDANSEYWENAVKQMLRNAITMLLMCDLPITMENIYHIILTAPQKNDITGEIEAQTGMCSQLLDMSTPQHFRDTKEYQMARDYFYVEFAKHDPRTRANTISSFSVTADAMQRGELARCFATEKSTLRLEDLFENHKILVVDYDVKTYARIGQYAAAIIKYCFEQMIERRPDITDDNAAPVFLWADECQFFSIEYDQKFQTTARSSRTLTTYATQNLGNLYDGYGKEKATSLLGNLGTKFFCQNGEFETNEWASKSIGQEIVRRRSQNFGDSKSTSGKGDYNRSNSFSGGWSEQKDYRVDPATFASLQTGGPRGQCKVGFVFWQSGRILNNGETFVQSTIEQRCMRICGARFERHCPPIPQIGKRGSFVGQKKYLLPADWIHLGILIITSAVCSLALYLMYSGTDHLLFHYKNIYLTWASFGLLSIAFFLNSLLAMLMALPSILWAIFCSGHRKIVKTVNQIPFADSIVYYMVGSFILTLWLQSCIYDEDWRQVAVVLFIWTGACVLYRNFKTLSSRRVGE